MLVPPTATVEMHHLHMGVTTATAPVIPIRTILTFWKDARQITTPDIKNTARRHVET